MIEIKNKVVKEQKSFFNQCVFHPTDAVEDPWGKRILDRMASDGAIDTIRIYAMLEDIVYLDENGKLAYDFRLSDLRLDYLVERGYKLVIAYAGVPDCIAKSGSGRTSVSKNKTRYKGKLWNTNPPKDYALWEEVCYEYTKHIVERYGDIVAAEWRAHCFNEPDMTAFLLSNVDTSNTKERCDEYLLMYEAFVKGVRRATDKLLVGGPALAVLTDFLDHFLRGVKERDIELNYIALHFYGTSPEFLNTGSHLSVDEMMSRVAEKLAVVKKHGFENTPITVDEWGASSHGFFNSEECKILMFRETEVNSAYYVRFIYELMKAEIFIDNLMICLSGQHEMTEDFSGFRNFFTLNFIAKPVYNAYVLTSRLGEAHLDFTSDNPDVAVIPTKTDGGYAVALAYSKDGFGDDLPPITERISVDGLVGKRVTVLCIDREHTNPYRLYQRLGIGIPTEEEIALLREEGRLKPIAEFVARDNTIEMKMTANSVFLITAE